MRFTLALAALPALGLIAAPAAADDRADIARVLSALYEHYRSPDFDSSANGPPFSASTKALIGEWEAGMDPEGDLVDELADFDWFCECQDWDAGHFAYKVSIPDDPGAGEAEAVVAIDQGFGEEPREETFRMVRDGRAWVVDDLHSESFPLGLKYALGSAIAVQENAENLPKSEFDLAILMLFREYIPGIALSRGDADWDMGGYSAETQALIDRWKQGFVDGEIIDLQDFGWLCGCQDWESSSFRVEIGPHDDEPKGDRAEVDLEVHIGWDYDFPAHLVMVREEGAWMVDDLVTPYFPQGLKAELKQAVAEDAPAG